MVYAALFGKPGLVPGWREQDQMQTNLAMMRNLMDPLLAAAKGLAHVSVLQGSNWRLAGAECELLTNRP